MQREIETGAVPPTRPPESQPTQPTQPEQPAQPESYEIDLGLEEPEPHEIDLGLGEEFSWDDQPQQQTTFTGQPPLETGAGAQWRPGQQVTIPAGTQMQPEAGGPMAAPSSATARIVTVTSKGEVVVNVDGRLEMVLEPDKLQAAPGAQPTAAKGRRAAPELGPQHGANDAWGREGPTPDTYHEQSATDNYAGRRQPASAALGFVLSDLRRRGRYVIGTVTWAPENTKAMSSGNVEQNIISFVKGRSTKKEIVDLGNIGRVRVRTLDLQEGIAEVAFQSDAWRNFPPEIIEVDEGERHRG
jgi:hypothetical protein